MIEVIEEVFGNTSLTRERNNARAHLVEGSEEGRIKEVFEIELVFLAERLKRQRGEIRDAVTEEEEAKEKEDDNDRDRDVDL